MPCMFPQPHGNYPLLTRTVEQTLTRRTVLGRRNESTKNVGPHAIPVPTGSVLDEYHLSAGVPRCKRAVLDDLQAVFDAPVCARHTQEAVHHTAAISCI